MTTLTQPPQQAGPGSSDGAPASTSSRATRVLGLLVLVGSVIGAFLGLVTSDADAVQGDAVRLFYVHVPVVTLMYLPVAICTLGSIMWLRKRTDGWDALAHASAEIAALFVGLGLVSGMLWGNITWGAYWTWDARLTSTALLFLLLAGYLAIRRYPTDPANRSRLAAVVGILLVPNAILVHFSVSWWRSLHQESTLKRLDPTIEGNMLSTYAFAQAVFALLLVWLLIHRFRLAWLEIQAERRDLEVALSDRVADDDPTGGIG